MWTHLLDGITTLSKGDIDRVVCASLDVEDLSDEMAEVCEKLREEIGSSPSFDVGSLKVHYRHFKIKPKLQLTHKHQFSTGRASVRGGGGGRDDEEGGGSEESG